MTSLLERSLKPSILRSIPKVTKEEEAGQVLVPDYPGVLMPMQIV